MQPRDSVASENSARKHCSEYRCRRESCQDKLFTNHERVIHTQGEVGKALVREQKARPAGAELFAVHDVMRLRSRKPVVSRPRG